MDMFCAISLCNYIHLNSAKSGKRENTGWTGCYFHISNFDAIGMILFGTSKSEKKKSLYSGASGLPILQAGPPSSHPNRKLFYAYRGLGTY